MDVDAAPTGDAASWALAEAHNAPSDLKPLLERAAELLSRRLYYQLSSTLSDIIARPSSASLQVELYQRFISEVSGKLDPLALVGLAVRVARQYARPEEAVAFLEGVTERLDASKAPEARVMAVIETASYRLHLGQLDQTKLAIDQSSVVLDGLPSIEITVHASFYRVSGEYHKVKAEYADFYRASLLYLACVDVHRDLSAIDRVHRAHDLAVSALLGTTIYNFGELLMHPILDSLLGTSHEWLRKLLFAFNEGAIGKFESLMPLFPQEPILQESHAFLRQKICLMALIEAIFLRPAGSRIIRFDVVAQETRLPEAEVEHLIMKALSLGLIRGAIDEVARTVSVTWVQPRVLDKPQITALRDRIADWCGRVAETGRFASSVAPELLTAQ